MKNSTRVTLHFTLSFPDGTEVESTRDDEPMVISLGQGDMHAGLEAYLLDMSVGDAACFNIAPGEAFDEPDIEAVIRVDRSEFPVEMELAEGQVIGFSSPAGDEIPGTVMEITEDGVIVDFNHPLSGRDLIFDVEILKVDY